MKKRETSTEGMITTTVAFDRATYKQLGHLAVDEEIPVRELIRRAVEEYLRRHQKGGSNR
jgi:predicted DNA-binding ribbon-helix-helix protein